MRNLKRALSLALASVMLLGMMVVGTGASYADVDSADNVEAIEVIQAVGVMSGDDKGNFNPDQKVTRGEMAVVMANLLNLKVNDFLNAKLPFTDVPQWAVPYVAACYADGITAGISATEFGFNYEVTTAQAALMMMKALGYFQFMPDFGNDWQLATIKQGSKIELFEGIDAGASAALTRNEVAQLALNTLESDMVYYTGSQGTNINLPDGTSVISGYTIQYWPEGDNTYSTYDYTPGVGNTEGDGYKQLVEKLYGDDLKKTGASDDFGRDATEWKYKTNSIGKYSDKADMVYANKVTRDTLYNLVGKDVVTALKDSTKTGATLTVISDGQSLIINSKSSSDIDKFFAEKDSTAIGATGTARTGNGSKTEVFVDDDTSAVTIVIINTYLVKATDDYNAKKETVTTTTVGDVTAPVASTELTISSEDFNVTNVKEDDYLLITCAGVNATNKAIKSVTPATVLTGTVNSYSTGNSVTIDGTKYEYAFMADTTGTHGKAVTYAIGEAAKVVTDGTYILYVDEATVASDKFVYVSAIENDGKFGENDYVAKAYFLDGTVKTISLKDKYADNSSITLPTDATPNTWFTYSVNNDNVYTLGKLNAADGSGDVENETQTVTTNAGSTGTPVSLVENGKVTVGIDVASGTAVKANNSTIFVVVDEDKNVTSYTGIANVPTIKAKGTAVTANYVLANNTAYAKYVFIDASSAAIDGATSASGDFIYLLKYDSTNMDSDKNTYYTYKAIVNGEVTTINLNDNFNATDSSAPNAKYTLYTDVKYDENGYVDSMNVVDASDDYTNVNTTLTTTSVTYEDGVLTLGTHDFVVGKDCKIYLIAADSNVKEDAGATYEVSTGLSANGLYNTLKGYNVTGNFSAQVDDDTNTLTTLYVYVSATAAV